MLQTIRERIQGWVAGTIISLIIISFLFWGIHSYFQGNSSKDVAATINGHDISKEQFAVAYERLRREEQQNNHTNFDEVTLKEKTLRALIEMEVVKQASQKAGYRISDTQIDNYLMSMPEFQENGEFSSTRFQSILSTSLLSANEVIDIIHTGLLIDQPKLGILLSSFALPNEINQTIGLVDESRQFDYLLIPKELFLKKKYDINVSEIENYYNSNKNNFMTPERVRLEYVEISVPELMKITSITEDQIKSYYNENINSYTRPERWQLEALFIPQLVTADKKQISDSQKKAEEILSQAKNNQNLQKLRTEFGSSDFDRKKWITLSEVSQDLQASVKNLSQTNDWSAPILTSRGIYLIHVIARQAPALESYQDVHDKVKSALLRQRAEENFANMRERLADLTYAHPDTLLPASQELKLKIKETEWFTRKQADLKGILAIEKIRAVAFSNDVLALRNNSDVLVIGPDSVVVVRVKSYQPSTLLPLSAVQNKIMDYLRSNKVDQAMHDYAGKLVNQLKSGVLPQALAESNQLNWILSSKFLSRYGESIDPAIIDLAFRLPNPDLVSNKISAGAVRLTKGYALVLLKKIQAGEPKDKKQVAVFGEQIQNSQGILEYDLYKQSLIKQSDIQIHLEK